MDCRQISCRSSDTEQPEIVKEEVRRGVRRLKGWKAAGICGGEVVVQWLTEFFNMVWRVGVE